jgi:hypothetical protein
MSGDLSWHDVHIGQLLLCCCGLWRLQSGRRLSALWLNVLPETSRMDEAHRLNTGFPCSNSFGCMDICPHFQYWNVMIPHLWRERERRLEEEWEGGGREDEYDKNEGFETDVKKGKESEEDRQQAKMFLTNRTCAVCACRPRSVTKQADGCQNKITKQDIALIRTMGRNPCFDLASQELWNTWQEELDSPALCGWQSLATWAIRTVITAVVHQDHFLDKIGWRPVQHAAMKNGALKHCLSTVPVELC